MVREEGVEAWAGGRCVWDDGRDQACGRESWMRDEKGSEQQKLHSLRLSCATHTHRERERDTSIASQSHFNSFIDIISRTRNRNSEFILAKMKRFDDSTRISVGRYDTSAREIPQSLSPSAWPVSLLKLFRACKCACTGSRACAFVLLPAIALAIVLLLQ